MFSMKYLLCFAIVLIFSSTAFAVHCYTCGSLGNKKCGEPFEAEENMKGDCNKTGAPLYILSTLTGGSFNATGCMTQTVEAPLGGGTYIMRSCYFGDTVHTDNGCKLDPLNNVGSKLGSCVVCTGDYCNGSSAIAPLTAAVVMLVALANIFS